MKNSVIIIAMGTGFLLQSCASTRDMSADQRREYHAAVSGQEAAWKTEGPATAAGAGPDWTMGRLSVDQQREHMSVIHNYRESWYAGAGEDEDPLEQYTGNLNDDQKSDLRAVDYGGADPGRRPYMGQIHELLPGKGQYVAISGRVVGVEQSVVEMIPTTVVLLSTRAGQIRVDLGATTTLRQMKMIPAEDEPLEVEGALFSLGGEEIFMVTNVRRGQRMVQVREKEDLATWARSTPFDY